MSDQEDVARRAYLGVTRGTLVKSDESKKLAEVTIRDRFGEVRSNVEHWTPFGFTYVPLPPKDGKEAEALIVYLGGSPDHPIVIGTADRRHRPKNLQPGESALHDDQGQIAKLGRDGYEITAKKFKITCGSASIEIADGKITLTGEIHLGGTGGKLVHRKDDVDSGGDTAVGSSSKVYAV